MDFRFKNQNILHPGILFAVIQRILILLIVTIVKMKVLFKGAVTGWNALLLFSVIFAAFILPVLPIKMHSILFRFVFSVIYLAAVFSLEKRSKYIFTLLFATFLIEWISGIFDLPLLKTIARGTNIVFFLVVVFSLIWQIAGAKKVNSEVILGSIAGYLLLGIIYSIFIAFIIQQDPAAFSGPSMDTLSPGSGNDTSIPLYYSFVTLATLGYGDIFPLKPYARSLATWITISGQFYIAIIVALLVGKFSSQRRNH